MAWGISSEPGSSTEQGKVLEKLGSETRLVFLCFPCCDQEKHITSCQISVG